MANTSMNIRMDEELKKQAEALFGEIGMNMTTAINIFLRQAIRENAIPFTISRDVPNAVTEAAIMAAEKDEAMYGPFDSVDALMEALNA